MPVICYARLIFREGKSIIPGRKGKIWRFERIAEHLGRRKD
jgi:hypothetical protein